MNTIARVANINGISKTQELLRVSTQALTVARSFSNDVTFIERPEIPRLKKGRGGRSSFSGVVATVFGATGVLGRRLCNDLGKIGSQMIIPYRGDPYHVRNYKLLGDLGQVLFIPYHICNEEAIRKAVKHSNVVINLVGRDWETRNFSYKQVHVDAAERIARISKEMGVEKFIHVSALNSNMEHEGYFLKGGSRFLQTKGEGEQRVMEQFPDAIIFRPSDMYGQQDRFLRYFCRYSRHTWSFVSLPYAGKGIWKAPVYVGDVAKGIVNAVQDNFSRGTIYEAFGPRAYELADLIDWFSRVMYRKQSTPLRPLAPFAILDLKYDPTVWLRARLNEFNPSVPTGTLVRDKVDREAVTDTSFGHPNLKDLGVNLTKMEDRIEWELKFFYQQDQMLSKRFAGTTKGPDNYKQVL